MVSDDEIIALALAARADVSAGRKSLYQAGEDFMRAFLQCERDERAPTPPGVIGN
jgi:hypothetical protein